MRLSRDARVLLSLLALAIGSGGGALMAKQTQLPPPPGELTPDDLAPDAFATDLPPAPTPGPAPAPAAPDFGPAPEPFNPRATPAQPAVAQPSTPQLQGNFNLRLARAPKMLGDFFGNSNAAVDGATPVGTAVLQTVRLSDTSNVDGLGNFRLIAPQRFFDATDPINPIPFDEAVYIGGTDGDVPGTVFSPGTRTTGLTGNGAPGEFVAEATGDFQSVFVNLDDDNGNGVIEVPNSSLVDEAVLDLDDGAVFAISEVIAVEIPAGGPGDIIGRVRLQDNNSAMPQDRFYFDYSFFHNAALTSSGVDVNRFSPGLEKTFLDGMASVEVRVPFGATLNSTQVAGASPDVSNFEFGNIIIAPKLLLSSDNELAFACGLGVALPTADDIRVNMGDGTAAVLVENEAVHLLPYVAFTYAPARSNSFAHFFVTYDFDTGGNATFANLTGGGLEWIGNWNDQNLVTVDLAYGQWVYRARSRRERLQSVAWSTELHYTGTLNDADVVQSGGFTIGNPYADLALLNGTVGGHVQLGGTTFTAGYTVPLTSSDRVFDGELRLFVNRPF